MWLSLQPFTVMVLFGLSVVYTSKQLLDFEDSVQMCSKDLLDSELGRGFIWSLCSNVQYLS